jgi:acetylornithine deacetylase/succinyl-diaminopimelate desuccinylase-like protein
MGLGLPDDQIHASNEHFGLDRLEKGFLIIARALQVLSNPQI